MTSFTKLKCRWTSVLALSLPSKLNLILFYCHVIFRYEVNFGHLIFNTLSTELFKTIMAWITEDLKSTCTLRLQGLKKIWVWYVQSIMWQNWPRSKCKGRWLHYIYWSNCKWPDSSSTMSNELILGAPGGNHWLIDSWKDPPVFELGPF